MKTYFMAAFAVVTMLAGSMLIAPAHAQDSREAEIIGLRQLCDHGDRGACVRFGMLMQQNRDRHDAWRHSHPEFFFYEH